MGGKSGTPDMGAMENSNRRLMLEQAAIADAQAERAAIRAQEWEDKQSLREADKIEMEKIKKALAEKKRIGDETRASEEMLANALAKRKDKAKPLDTPVIERPGYWNPLTQKGE